MSLLGVQLDLRKGGNKVEYLVVLEKSEGNWAAYSPDVPGCIATGSTPEETLQEYQEALRMHLKGLAEDGLPIPKPNSKAQYISVI
jgi:predicted RNase H-like HicB family nuclease